jgi:hypothetical protein
LSNKLPKAFLAALLISSLPRTTIQGAELGIVGEVVESRGASLGGVPIPGASTILAGDVLSTEQSGRALVSFSSGDRLNLTGDTSVTFEGEPGGVVARMSHGDLLAEAYNPRALTIETSRYRITPDNARPATCLVAILGDHRTVISARRGRISVTDLRSGTLKGLVAGEQVVMSDPAPGGQEPEPSQPAPPKPAAQAPPPSAPSQPTEPAGTSTPAATHKSNTGLILLLVGAGAAAGVGAALAGGGHGGGAGGPVSPSAP